MLYCEQCNANIFQDELSADKLKRVDLLRASLDVPPSVNHLYENRKGGGKFLSKAARTWRDGATLILKSANTWKNHDAIAHARSSQSMLAFRMQAFLPPSKIKRRDLDNLAKITQDTVTRAIEIDDVQIFELHISKHPLKPKQAAFILVALETLEV